MVEQNYELIIAEKPKAAEKIAAALAGRRAKSKRRGRVSYFTLKRHGRLLVVVPAAGHLYGLAELDKAKGWHYPSFELGWRPLHEIERGSAFAQAYLATIKELAKHAHSFTVACDYDLEGELIGWNVLRFACGVEDGARMRFSTLIKDDLVRAYESKADHLERGLAAAGEVRHRLDWYWGVNLSRALTAALKAAGLFRVLSIGRVQGPALALIAAREREIRTFKSQRFWQLGLCCAADQARFIASHERDRFFDKAEFESVLATVRDLKSARVVDIESRRFVHSSPHPFDLTALQLEAYRCFKLSPKTTLEIAQELYVDGLISYPRTSSQKLPPELGWAAIISALAKQPSYADVCKALLEQKKLSPAEGPKTDPAHPAIYPTGQRAGKLSQRAAKLYDIIVRRFLATFAPQCIRQRTKALLELGGQRFVAQGTTTLAPGWTAIYNYVRFKESELPKLSKDQTVKVLELLPSEGKTQPPKRYTPATIVRELERKALGTKATRAEIVDTLLKRGYASGESIELTELGASIVETLESYCSRILDEALTRHFERDVEAVQAGQTRPEAVLAEARLVLTEILTQFRAKETEIGAKLKAAVAQSERKARLVGSCPVCASGHLRMVLSRKSGKRFLACDRYPDCKITLPLPQSGLLRTKGPCKACGWPTMALIRKARRPWTFCVNKNCPSKQAAPKSL